MVCQLKQQTLHRGHLAAYNELFIERAIQALKRIVDRRTTSHPEKVIVNTILTKLATANFRVQHGCPTIEELLGTGMQREIYEVDLPKTVGDDKPDKAYFRGQTSWRGQRNHRFAGQGHKLRLIDVKHIRDENKEQLAAALVQHMHHQRQHQRITLKAAMIDDFQALEASQNRIRLHTACQLATGEQVTSVAHTLEVSNESFWVIAKLKCRNNRDWDQVRVVKILRFAMCKMQGPPTAQWTPPPYRAALGVVYHTE